jgi:Fe-S cluster biogenesis protein NfuA
VLDAHSDPEVRRVTRTAVSLLVDLYGTGLARMVEVAREQNADALVDRFGRDPLVGPLLAVRGDHPHGVDRRIAQALDDVRPTLAAQACHVRVNSIDGPSLRVTLTHEPGTCGSTVTAARQAIETAVLDLVPELTSITFEDRAVQTSAVIPLDGLRRGGMALSGAASEARP